MKGNGLAVQSFDNDLRMTLKTDESRWFYNKELGIMVHLTNDKSKPELKIMMSQRLTTDKVKNMYMALRALARTYNLSPTVRIFGKHLEPKDFTAAAANISESNAFGSTKTSYHPTIEAKVVVRHTKPVAEEKPGARSRNIEQIFIDNNKGERFQFKVPYLAAARAMARHVSDGGNPYDEKGLMITDMAEERQSLRRALSYARKNNIMDGLDEEIGLALGRIDEIDHALKKFYRRGGDLENPVKQDIEVSESSKTKFVVHQFDESLMPALVAIEKQRKRVGETLAARLSVDTFEKKVAEFDGTMLPETVDDMLDVNGSFLRRSGLKESYDLVMVRSHRLAETHMQRVNAALKLAKSKQMVPDDKSTLSLHEEAINSILGRINRTSA